MSACENCTAMPRDELEAKLKNISESVEEIKKILDKIDSRQQDHYEKILKQASDIKYLQKTSEEEKKDVKEKFKEQKDDQKTKFDHLWSEVRRRDKKNMWLTSLLVSIGAIIASIASMFISK